MNTVKELRKATKMSQHNFASYLGIPEANIKRWEQETHNPPSYVITLITRVMRNDGYLGNDLSPVQIDAIRQTCATLTLENMIVSETANINLQKLAKGEINREEYQRDLKLKYKNHEIY